MTIKKAKVISIIMSVVISVLAVIYPLHMRIENLRDLYLNKGLICIAIIWIVLMALFLNSTLGLTWIQYLINKDNEKKS